MTMEKQPCQDGCPMKDGDFPLAKMFLLPWWQKIWGKKHTSSQRQQARNPSCQQVSNEKGDPGCLRYIGDEIIHS